MAIAIISDIHSNYEALSAVIKDIRSLNVQHIYCLGDLVGYGPDPAAIVDEAMQWPMVIMGNHDEAVIKQAYGFNPVARAAVDWTRSQLKPGLFSSTAKRSRWNFLAGLKVTYRENGCLFVHGSPRDPTMEYILRSDCVSFTREIPEKIRDIFSQVERLCFVGHTHDPCVITERAEYLSPRDIGSEYRFESGKKYIVNPGSVGQPRDGDTRASYLVYDPGFAPAGKILWRRITYDFRVTMQRIFSIPQLDRRAGDRLAQGK
jgi:predicted phosphodiesterase